MKSRPTKPRRRKTGEGGAARGGGRYNHNLPSHVKEFKTKTRTGRKIYGYVSRISGRRISVKKIRSRRDEQALRERFPNARTTKNIKGFLEGWQDDFATYTPAERKFVEDSYKDLFDYLKKNAPEMLPDAQLASEITDFKEEAGEDVVPQHKKKRKTKTGVRSKKLQSKRGGATSRIRKRRIGKPRRKVARGR